MKVPDSADAIAPVAAHTIRVMQRLIDGAACGNEESLIQLLIVPAVAQGGFTSENHERDMCPHSSRQSGHNLRQARPAGDNAAK